MSLRERIAVVVAGALYLAVGVFPYLVSTLVVPTGAAFVLWGTWMVGLVPLVRLAGQRPMWTLAAAPLALVVWVVYVQTGSWLFGWTA